MLFESKHDFGEYLYAMQDNKIICWRIKKIIFCSDSNFKYDEYKPKIEYIITRVSEKYAEVKITESEINKEFFWNKQDLIKYIDTTI